MSFSRVNGRIVGPAFTVAAIVAFQACASAPPQERRPTVTNSATELTRITSDPLPEFWPVPSPDGSMLLFNQRDDEKLGNDRFAVIRMNVGSPARTLVTDEAASSASWFGDNRFFAYETARTGPLRIVKSVAAGGGGGMTFLTSATTGTGEQNPDVNAEGRIAFNTSMRGDTIIATVDEGSSNVTVYGEGLRPRWSPDGTKIAYYWRDRGTWQLFVMNVERGAQITQLTAGENVNNFHPSWSPDGRFLTYISDQDGEDHLYIMRSDGTGATQLTTGDSEESGPAWSSDGYIYFASDASGNWDIWRLRPLLDVLGGP